MKKHFLFLCFLIYLTACQPPNSSPTQSNKPLTQITLKAIGNTMEDMDFDLKTLKVPANSRIQLKLVNKGTAPGMLHNIVFVKDGTADKVGTAAINLPNQNFVPDIPDVLAASPLARPGETVTIEFDSPPIGRYQYICTYPGHHVKMRGILMVH